MVSQSIRIQQGAESPAAAAGQNLQHARIDQKKIR
jgi:hypothetical protein